MYGAWRKEQRAYTGSIMKQHLSLFGKGPRVSSLLALQLLCRVVL